MPQHQLWFKPMSLQVLKKVWLYFGKFWRPPKSAEKAEVCQTLLLHSECELICHSCVIKYILLILSNTTGELFTVTDVHATSWLRTSTFKKVNFLKTIKQNNYWYSMVPHLWLRALSTYLWVFIMLWEGMGVHEGGGDIGGVWLNL